MAVTRKSPGYKIDGRVSIALNALDDKQKQAVTGVLTDRARFVASTADRRKVSKDLEGRSALCPQHPVRAANHLLPGRG